MDARIYRLLAGLNRHWATGQVAANIRKSAVRRPSFHPLAKRVGDDTFHVIVGPRQVGKTTTLGHLMQTVVDHTAPRQVVYIPLDHPGLRVPLDALVEDLMQRVPGPLYLFLDELQESDDWAAQLKGIYDRWVGQVHVVASGSSALALSSARGLGVGRWHYHWMLPLKFRELVRGPWEANKAFVDALRGGDLTAAFPLLQETYDEIVATHPDVEARFFEYLVRGGYPAAQGDDWLAFLHDVVHQGLLQDVTWFTGMRKPRVVLDVLERLARAHGGKVNLQHHAKELDATRQTLTKWMGALEQAFMVRLVPAVRDSGVPDSRKPVKCYIQDPGVRAYLTGETMREAVEAGRLGEVVEGVVLDHLHRLQSRVARRRDATLGYRPDKEVDFVATLPAGALAVEVKFGQDEPGHLAHSSAQMRIVITRERFELGPVLYLPAWFFCWLC